MACPHANSCALYKHFQVQETLKVWKVFYCNADYTRCARYKLSAEMKPVPTTLLPNGVDVAKSNTGS